MIRKAETRAVASVFLSEPGESSPPAGGGVAAASADGVVGAGTGFLLTSASKNTLPTGRLSASFIKCCRNFRFDVIIHIE